ncbi:hypothetical protein M0813_10301 [Anaeramoeba flamelloides]|uniref:Uncharacterized protein n=1 Tax=Anaeramoeba flamelloides TaxID=1746091 RepID=A0AAV7ZMF6_9EUKA|nr:hypothetical protein M0812_12103 [Anaeramoeba flamelloides]KAJ6226767.1 hypothetical protein M0813_10301 [Anaeramoeba flamelloides]
MSVENQCKEFEERLKSLGPKICPQIIPKGYSIPTSARKKIIKKIIKSGLNEGKCHHCGAEGKVNEMKSYFVDTKNKPSQKEGIQKEKPYLYLHFLTKIDWDSKTLILEKAALGCYKCALLTELNSILTLTLSNTKASQLLLTDLVHHFLKSNDHKHVLPSTSEAYLLFQESVSLVFSLKTMATAIPKLSFVDKNHIPIRDEKQLINASAYCFQKKINKLEQTGSENQKSKRRRKSKKKKSNN